MDNISSILYKINYVVGKDNSLLKEHYELNETRKTKELATKVLVGGGIDQNQTQELINQFESFDVTNNQNMTPTIAAAYLENNNIDDLKNVFSSIGEDVKSGKIKHFQKTKKGYQLNDKTFRNFLELSEFIHGQQQFGAGEKYLDKTSEKSNVDPIWENDKFAIFDGDSPQTCITLAGSGQVSDKRLPFCIGWYGGGMWQSYRDTKDSSFYYVADKLRDKDDPLHVVVVDSLNPEVAKQKGYNAPVELTDFNNRTGSIAEFGNDFKKYLEYLKSNGVPVEKMQHKEKTEEERLTTDLLKGNISDLKTFLKLGSLAKEKGLKTDLSDPELNFKLQSQYIGRGKRLTEEQYDYLMTHINQKAAYHLIKQYVSTGNSMSNYEMGKLVEEANK